MLIAAIDIGTNSIHMVIARATGPGAFEVVDREREVVQIGRGSFDRGRLRAEAIQRTAEALGRFTQLARRHLVDKILCTATAAVREAKNGGDFLAAARVASGVTPRVIPAEEEGRLIYLGVKSALELGPESSLIIDIGGGSVQLVVGNRDRLEHVSSAPLGALRLTERMLESDPPARRELSRLARTIKKTLRPVLKAVGKFTPGCAYGSSGSIHALAHLAHGLETGHPVRQINGHVLDLPSLARLTRKLQKMTAAEIEKLPGIDARRSEIIVPGAMVLLEVLDRLGLDGITISDFGVREGLVTDYVSTHAQEISRLDGIEDLRLRSVLHLASKFQVDLPHAEHVAHLALQLFDGLARVHRLGPADREILRHASLLHDIGAAIGYDGHPEHSHYIIRHGNLRGFSSDEIDRIANVARFHGKSRPRKRDKSYRELDKPARRAVRWLASLVRIAEGLDRSHYQLIRGLTVRRSTTGVSLRLSTPRDAQLELWAARRRADMLEELLGMPVRISLALGRRSAADKDAEAARGPAARRAARARAASPPVSDRLTLARRRKSRATARARTPRIVPRATARRAS